MEISSSDILRKSHIIQRACRKDPKLLSTEDFTIHCAGIGFTIKLQKLEAATRNKSTLCKDLLLLDQQLKKFIVSEKY